MDKNTVKEFARMQNKLNELGKRIDNHAGDMHIQSVNDITDLQEVVIDNAYNAIIDELGV